MADQPSPRPSIVSAYKAIKASGEAVTQDVMQRRLPGVSATIISTTLHVIALAEASGRLTVSGIRQWQDERRAAGDLAPELAKGFSTTSGHEILRALGDSEPVEAQRMENSGEGIDAEDDEGTRSQNREGGGTVARPEILELLRHWQETAEQDRKEAAAQARKVEREIADAQLATERERLSLERARAQSQLSVTRAHYRMGLIGVTILALGAGSIGTWWILKAKPMLAEVPQQSQPPQPTAEMPVKKPALVPLTEEPKPLPVHVDVPTEGGAKAVPAPPASTATEATPTPAPAK